MSETAKTHGLDPAMAASLARSRDLEAMFPVRPGNIDDIRARARFLREFWNSGGNSGVVAESRLIPGIAREVPVALYVPRRPTAGLPVFVFLHGGGFTIGDEWSNDFQMREIAARWGGAVISVDYLHLPEYVFPAAVEETAAVLNWLNEYGDIWDLDGERIGVGGLSAGASVALGALVHLGARQWVKGAVSIAGALDFSHSCSMAEFGDGSLFPASHQIAAMHEAYVPDEHQRSDPRVCLLRADPGVFPSTLVVAAQLDVLKDASTSFSRRLELAGRLARYEVYEGMSHLFFGMSRDVPGAARCIGDIAAFLAATLPVERESN